MFCLRTKVSKSKPEPDTGIFALTTNFHATEDLRGRWSDLGDDLVEYAVFGVLDVLVLWTCLVGTC